MATITDAGAKPRTPLSRERVLRAVMDLADESGIDVLSMRKLGQMLGMQADRHEEGEATAGHASEFEFGLALILDGFERRRDGSPPTRGD